MDVVVIGAGPAVIVAALRAAELGPKRFWSPAAKQIYPEFRGQHAVGEK
jgi:flavin-dependent dehydrogenase